MPVTLLVRRKGDAEDLPPIAFDAPRIVLGRRPSCDLHLPDTSVSGRHASIRLANGGYTIVDEGSTNGTLLNGERLAPQGPRLLKTGDRLQLGRMELTVKLGAAKAAAHHETRALAAALVARALATSSETVAKIVVEGGPDAGQEWRLEGAEVRVIGRDPRCTMRLRDGRVPPMAVGVQLVDGLPRLTRHDARGDMHLEGQELQVDESLPWGDAMVLRLGDSLLRMHDPIARQLQHSVDAEDEPMRAEERNAANTASAGPAGPEGAEGAAGAAAAAESGLGASAGDKPAASEGASAAPVAPRPKYERRRSWRRTTRILEVLALLIGTAVFLGSVAGLVWLFAH